ncbi:hypothetical protein [Pseudonocardia sp. EC080625-04]|uniref:hypothetical protein n=1 Tax=Pseudonocardia sp. EC080625-04 TaxID=1096868 RepID=UPI0007616B40|nr:hypothetical protein [Pseudonocardia sp. EC080625-04]
MPNGNAPNGTPPNGGAPYGTPFGAPNGAGPNGAGPNGAGPNGAPHGPNGHGPNGAGPQAFAPNGRPAPNGAPPAPDGAQRGPFRPDDGYGPPDAGPYGSEGADEIPTSRMNARRPAAGDPDGGPPTQFGAPALTDDDGAPYDGAPYGSAPYGSAPADAGPPTGAYDPFADDGDSGEWERDPHADGGRTGVLPRPRPDADEYDDYEDHGELEHGALPDDDGQPRRRRSRDEAQPPAGLDDAASAGAAGTGQAWAVVIAQWIGGAVAGAGIWVLFRFLWFSFPIVALALAVVLTVGLVLGVRALLRNDDLKTTLFAVLVGLLLTVSPAILVLLDR